MKTLRSILKKSLGADYAIYEKLKKIEPNIKDFQLFDANYLIECNSIK